MRQSREPFFVQLSRDAAIWEVMDKHQAEGRADRGEIPARRQNTTSPSAGGRRREQQSAGRQPPHRRGK